MMIALVGDPHLGNFSRHGGVKTLGMNERCRATVDVLDRALRLAQAEGAKVVVILGDLFDTMRPEPQLIARVREVFASSTLQRIILLKGNHDSASDAPGDTALYACAEENCDVVDEPTVFDASGVRLWLVPYRSGAVADWLPGVLNELSARCSAGGPAARVLCLHAGIRDDETAPWLRDAPDAIDVDVLAPLLDEHEIRAVFAGNWHENKSWQNDGIFQVGALCPTGFSNLGLEPYGWVALLESGRDIPTFAQVPGPRFLKLGRDDTPEQVISGCPHSVYIEWKVPTDQLIEAQRRVEALIEAGKLAAGSAIPDTTGMGEGLVEAANAARESTSVAEALSAYVEGLTLPAQVDRARLYQRVRRYMGV
jgi:Calcineurin-like phosphoesterase